MAGIISSQEIIRNLLLGEIEDRQRMIDYYQKIIDDYEKEGNEFMFRVYTYFQERAKRQRRAALKALHELG